MKTFETNYGGKKISVQLERFAEQTNGAAYVQCGETGVLTTAVMGKREKEGLDYFPLSVEYDEKFYAAGMIKGSRFLKREGRPSEEAILSGRLIDRSIRPRFDHNIRREVQVINTVLSFDQENDPDIVAFIAASISLSISDIPWDGPVGAARVGLDENNQFILNPTYEEREKSKLDLIVAGTKDKINMIEAGANQIEEELIEGALEFAYQHIKEIISFQEEIVSALNPQKIQLSAAEDHKELKKEIKEILGNRLEEALFEKEKPARDVKIAEVEEYLTLTLKEKHEDSEEIIKKSAYILEEEMDEIIHRNVLNEEKRVDGRKLDELREITCEVEILPRTHGSGIFKRGMTQDMSIVTLGAPGLAQYMETIEFVGKKRFMLHYNFPPFCSGETGRLGFTKRREIGHGALSERALEAIIPDVEEFPYTIRVVSEILSSNGSTSMASTCGAVLALLDAGVPIKANVAGIAMGLMSDKEGNYKILTDIQGPEDHHGDMDLKVAGTRQGITALQMDVKIEGVSVQILKEAFAQAKKARLKILDTMEATISKPREHLSKYAPKIYTIQINPEKIGMVIGTGGKTINEIIAETEAEINIEEDGKIFITSKSEEGANKAIEWIEGLTKEAEVGEIYKGEVVKVMDFGAFVEIFPGQDGLVHISNLSKERVDKVTDVVREGDIIPVKVIAIDDGGKISLSLKDAK